MTLLIWLKIMADLSFYYAYAGFIASFTGSAFSLPGIVIPSILCAVSMFVPKDRRLCRTAVMLPGIVCFLLPGMSSGDRIALIPALLYCGYLARTDTYDLSHTRQSDVFLLFVKSYPVFFIVMLLLGCLDRLMAYSLSPAVLTVTLCVFLMRVLRHEREIYTAPRFLLTNGMTLAAVLAAAWILHLKAVTDFLTSVLLAFYNNVIMPILMAVIYAAAGIITFVITPLFALFGQISGEEDTQTEMDLSGTDLSDFESVDQVQAQWLLQLLKALVLLALIALAAAVLVRLFRYLAGSHSEDADPALLSGEEHADPVRPDHAGDSGTPLSPLHPVNRVRRQYRRYLKLCRERGFTPAICHTSRDICHCAAGLYEDSSPADQLRELYIRARYQGCASREDAAAAEQLVNELRRQIKSA